MVDVGAVISECNLFSLLGSRCCNGEESDTRNSETVTVRFYNPLAPGDVLITTFSLGMTDIT